MDESCRRLWNCHQIVFERHTASERAHLERRIGEEREQMIAMLAELVAAERRRSDRLLEGMCKPLYEAAVELRRVDGVNIAALERFGKMLDVLFVELAASRVTGDSRDEHTNLVTLN